MNTRAVLGGSFSRQKSIISMNWLRLSAASGSPQSAGFASQPPRSLNSASRSSISSSDSMSPNADATVGSRCFRRIASTILCLRMPVSQVRRLDLPENPLPASAASSVSCTTSSASASSRSCRRATRSRKPRCLSRSREMSAAGMGATWRSARMIIHSSPHSLRGGRASAGTCRALREAASGELHVTRVGRAAPAPVAQAKANDCPRQTTGSEAGGEHQDRGHRICLRENESLQAQSGFRA